MDQIKAVGRRKASVARIFLSKGTGKVTINKKTVVEYFAVQHLNDVPVEPLKVAEMEKEFDIKVNVQGGGIKGQAEAIRLGICRALVEINEEFRPKFKERGWMRRDARVVERKKPGLRKARKSAQFSKR